MQIELDDKLIHDCVIAAMRQTLVAPAYRDGTGSPAYEAIREQVRAAIGREVIGMRERIEAVVREHAASIMREVVDQEMRVVLRREAKRIGKQLDLTEAEAKR